MKLRDALTIIAYLEERHGGSLYNGDWFEVRIAALETIAKHAFRIKSQFEAANKK